MDSPRRTQPRRSLLAALGATGLTALAGCSGDSPAGGSDDGTTVSPTVEPMAPPPGTSEQGIEDVSALVSNTRSALRSTSYDIKVVFPFLNWVTDTTTVRSNPEQKRNLRIYKGFDDTNQQYVADGTEYHHDDSDISTSYGAFPAEAFETYHEDNDEVSDLGESKSLGGILRTGSYTAAGTVTRDGRRLREFALESADLADGESPVSAESGVFVDSDGVVFEASLPYTSNEFERTAEWSFTIRALGDVTVTEPDWVEEV